ncbi:Hypothetical predicted protein [Paramuricea clavata]|uniref:Uncharacterized protein n=1 Tax=Paramuricea clavata TaxID=317549 RepID=A0A6S7G1L6_PARCT|nr:Hypothetical predicted protein [Paramuricea clavata]
MASPIPYRRICSNNSLILPRKDEEMMSLWPCFLVANLVLAAFREDNFQLRTCEEHDNQCAEIEEDPALSTTYGVNFLSALCQSRFYHVIGGLPGDAMHDVLEGCLQYECKELLKYLICERKFFSLNHLNSSIHNFDFGYQNDSDKPSPISELTLHSNSNTLHQRAAQMWCLARFVPLLVGAKVPETDEK